MNTIKHFQGNFKHELLHSALPETPFSVNTTSGFIAMMSLQTLWMYSSSNWRMRLKSTKYCYTLLQNDQFFTIAARNNLWLKYLILHAILIKRCKLGSNCQTPIKLIWYLKKPTKKKKKKKKQLIFPPLINKSSRKFLSRLQIWKKGLPHLPVTYTP